MASCAATPSLSIVTRTLDRPAFLKRAARSIQAQTRSDVEWVVVNDGGPSDAVDQIAADAESQGVKTIVVHEPVTRGMASAANVGVQSSMAPFVVLHDDDDSWQPEFVARTVSFLEENAGPAGVCTQVNQVNETVENDAIVETARFVMNSDLQTLSIADLLVHNRVVPIAFVYRRAIYDELGRYDDAMPVMDDWDFILRVIARHDIHVIPEPLANYHQRIDLLDRTNPASNTVVARRGDHSRIDGEIRDRMLRDELARGHVGFGFLAAIARINIRNDEMLSHTIEGLRRDLAQQHTETRDATHATAFDRYTQLEGLAAFLKARLDKIDGDRNSAEEAWQGMDMLERLSRCEDLLVRLNQDRERGLFEKVRSFFAGRSR